MLCLSHFRKIPATALTLEMKLWSPFFTISTWTGSVFLHTHTHTYTHNCWKKKIQTTAHVQDL